MVVKEVTESLIGGVTFLDFTNNEFPEVTKRAKEIVRLKAPALLKAGYKKVELDTIGGYYYRNISRGRFIPLTTMHNLRLLKR
jgi:hypothetical protein